MRTRSQSRRRRQQQVTPTFVEPFDLEKPNNNQEPPNPPVVTMADNRIMAEMFQAPTEGKVGGDDKKDDNDDDDDYDDHALIRNRGMGSSEIRNEKMQTTIPSPPRSPKKDLSSNKAIDQELTASSFYDTSNGKEICTNRDFQDSSCRDDAFYKHDHDDHQGDDAPPEGEKSAKRHKTSKSLKSARGSSSKQPIKDTNTLVSGQ
ncbi:hypothetical protein Tco_0087258 [Tanacetum coccineum]